MSQIRGSSGNLVEVNSLLHLKTVTETDVTTNPGNIGGIRNFHENDQGLLTGQIILKSPEVDVDYRTRVSQDILLDEEHFNYLAQNTGKHIVSTTTMGATYTAGQYTTNSGSITTATTGVLQYTYATFPMVGTGTLSSDVNVAFSNQPVANTFVEWGIGSPGNSTSAPGDGVFFRLSAAGLQGIASYGGTETSTGVFPLSNGTGTWVYTNNKRYQFIAYVTAVEAQFWVNDGSGTVLLGKIPLPIAQSRMVQMAAGHHFIKHRILGGAASGVLQAFFGSYCVRQGGLTYSNVPSTSGNRISGSYQGASGWTMGSLALFTNSTNPTAAVPTNTTAALGAGLGGLFWETDTLAVNTDGIICSYQIPAANLSVQGRRLVIRGVKIDTFVQTALTGGGYNEIWALNFGHTTVSLATAEGASAKARRVVPIGSRNVASGLAALTQLPTLTLDLGDAPVFVNPIEFVAISKRKVGTAPSAGVMAHTITFVYGWE